MIIRKIEKKERFDSYLISTYCFHGRVDDPETGRAEAENSDDEDWGAFSEDGRLMAHIINNRLTLNFDGTPVFVGGIGGVSTLPEFRSTGAVKEIFLRLLPEAYAHGEIFSTLYPFKQAFYRKFGYEVVTPRNDYEIQPALLSGYHEELEAKMYEPGAPVTAYLEIYNRFAKQFNFAMPRDEEKMAEHMKTEKLYKDRRFSYLLSKDGKNVAYLTFIDTYNESGAVLKVDEMAWLDKDGFNCLLSFLARFEADYAKICFSLPMGIDFMRIVKSQRAYDIVKATRQDFMVRIINAKKALEVMNKPADCDFLVEVKDEIIDENNGIWHVTNGQVTRVGSEKQADLRVGIRTLSQMVTGSVNFDEALLQPDLEVFSKEEMLSRVFVEKKLFINEHF